MDLSTFLPLAGRLTIATALGGLIGYQRERKGRPAGIRTHMLVALGAALITLVSESYGANGNDPARLAAQIVSGIGFLGAGTIIRHGSTVSGLTTAASLWTVAGIGIAAARGGGILWLAVFATLLALATLVIVDIVEDPLLIVSRRRVLSVLATTTSMGLVLEALARDHIAILSESRFESDIPGVYWFSLNIRIPQRVVLPVLLQRVVSLEGVHAAHWADRGPSEAEEAWGDE